jgi:hypothetical protein
MFGHVSVLQWNSVRTFRNALFFFFLLLPHTRWPSCLSITDMNVLLSLCCHTALLGIILSWIQLTPHKETFQTKVICRSYLGL